MTQRRPHQADRQGESPAPLWQDILGLPVGLVLGLAVIGAAVVWALAAAR